FYRREESAYEKTNRRHRSRDHDGFAGHAAAGREIGAGAQPHFARTDPPSAGAGRRPVGGTAERARLDRRGIESDFAPDTQGPSDAAQGRTGQERDEKAGRDRNARNPDQGSGAAHGGKKDRLPARAARRQPGGAGDRHQRAALLRGPRVKTAAASAQAAGARTIKTGEWEWRTTVSVTLPNTQRLTPERPWVHMATRLLGVFCAQAMISSGPSPSSTSGVTFLTPRARSVAPMRSR